MFHFTHIQYYRLNIAFVYTVFLRPLARNPQSPPFSLALITYTRLLCINYLSLAVVLVFTWPLPSSVINNVCPRLSQPQRSLVTATYQTRTRSACARTGHRILQCLPPPLIDLHLDPQYGETLALFESESRSVRNNRTTFPLARLCQHLEISFRSCNLSKWHLKKNFLAFVQAGRSFQSKQLLSGLKVWVLLICLQTLNTTYATWAARIFGKRN